MWLTIGSYAHLHQFKQAEDTAKKLDLDGLVVIGGDDSNTNACLLAENFRLKLVGICCVALVLCNLSCTVEVYVQLSNF